MKTDIYAQLSQLQAQRKVLEAQEAEVKLAILTDMEEQDITTINNKYGKFTTSSRNNYTYTEAVNKIAEKLKVLKLKEEQKGLATANKVTIYLTFTPAKKK